MIKLAQLIIISFVAISTTVLLNGCEKATSAVIEKTHLNTFLSLHNQYCEKKYDNHRTLIQVLDVAPELSLAKDFNSVYEVSKQGVSYAVSPEKSGCTTDVMIQSSGKLDLFSFEDINRALINVGYLEASEPISRKDVGTDQIELTIIEKKYISPKGEITILDFPLEKRDKYYMTLFTEKFSHTIDKKTSTLTMASIN